MKAVASMIVGLVLLASMVSATETTLDNTDAMAYVDSRVVEFCIAQNGVPQDVSVVVDPICKDVNGLLGCSAGDEYNPVGFSVTPAEATTGADGCVDLTLETNIANPADGGVFWYTVNGQVDGFTVGSETDDVFVPEFGVVASLGILGVAGLYILRKRN